MKVSHTVSASAATGCWCRRCDTVLRPSCDGTDGELLVGLPTLALLLWMHVLNATEEVWLQDFGSEDFLLRMGRVEGFWETQAGVWLHLPLSRLHSKETVGPACLTLGESGETEPAGSC